jgi:peptide/nickel transport system permease protein/oligopeptide transport system permease protein
MRQFSVDPTQPIQPPMSPAETAPAPNGAPKKERNASLWADAGRELIRNPVFVISAIVVLLVLSMALLPWLWTSTDPSQCDINLGKDTPNAKNIFGFSIQGCDYYAQVIYGSGPSIAVAVLATLGSTLLGGITGILAGYYGRWVDAVISRFTDMVLGIPFLLGTLTLLSLVPARNVYTVVLALIALGWPTTTRIMRASVIATRNMDYVQAARSLGASDTRLIFRHVLPNAIAPVIVVATIALGAYVGAEATLTFLGVGLRPPTVSWGVMIDQGTDWVLSGVPHLLLVPVGFLIATVLSFILMGDALRDALDPKLR